MGRLSTERRSPAPLVRDLSLSGDCHRDAYGLTFGIVERVLGLTVGCCISGNPVFAAYPFGYAVLLDLDFDEPVIANLLLLARLLGYARSVLRCAVG